MGIPENFRGHELRSCVIDGVQYWPLSDLGRALGAGAVFRSHVTRGMLRGLVQGKDVINAKGGVFNQRSIWLLSETGFRKALSIISASKHRSRALAEELLATISHSTSVSSRPIVTSPLSAGKPVRKKVLPRTELALVKEEEHYGFLDRLDSIIDRLEHARLAAIEEVLLEAKSFRTFLKDVRDEVTRS